MKVDVHAYPTGPHGTYCSQRLPGKQVLLPQSFYLGLLPGQCTQSPPRGAVIINTPVSCVGGGGGGAKGEAGNQA